MKKGWEKTTLGVAFTTVTGTTPPKNNAEFYGEFMPLVKPPELCDATIDSAADGLSLSGVGVARTVPRGSILVSCIGNLGKVGLNTIPVAFNQQINAILPNSSKAIPEFLFYQALSCLFKKQLEALASGTTVPIVNKSKFNSIEIVLPSLSEQQRIVGILDEAFDGIATAKANAEKNLQNARALFESHLQSVFTQRGEGWVERSLGEECEFSQGIQVDLKMQSEINKNNEQVRFLRIVDFTQGNEQPRYIDNPGAKFLVNSSDISIVRYGASTGFICNGLEGAIANNLFRVIPKNNYLSDRYLYWFLKSEAFQGMIRKSMNGAAMPAISFGMIKDIRLSYPQQSEQQLIADRLRKIYIETQHLESIYQQKLSALDELKKSLLHQAFSGKL